MIHRFSPYRLSPLLILWGCASCTSFYVPPPADIPLFENPGEAEVTFDHGESGTDLQVDIALPGEGKKRDGVVYASFELYDHLRSRNDSSDLRDQTEWSLGIGTTTRQGMWRFGLSAGLAVGEIDVDYARTKYGTVLLIFPFPLSIPQHLEGTYLRPWSEVNGSSVYDLSPLPCTVETGVFARVNAPFFTGYATTDSALDRFGLTAEPGIRISLSLFDVIAVEWTGGIGLPLVGPDWYYEYGTFGVRLMPGR